MVASCCMRRRVQRVLEHLHRDIELTLDGTMAPCAGGGSGSFSAIRYSADFGSQPEGATFDVDHQANADQHDRRQDMAQRDRPRAMRPGGEEPADDTPDSRRSGSSPR
jgi:hypothetical protein